MTAWSEVLVAWMNSGNTGGGRLTVKVGLALKHYMPESLKFTMRNFVDHNFFQFKKNRKQREKGREKRQLENGGRTCFPACSRQGLTHNVPYNISSLYRIVSVRRTPREARCGPQTRRERAIQNSSRVNHTIHICLCCL